MASTSKMTDWPVCAASAAWVPSGDRLTVNTFISRSSKGQLASSSPVDILRKSTSRRVSPSSGKVWVTRRSSAMVPGLPRAA